MGHGSTGNCLVHRPGLKSQPCHLRLFDRGRWEPSYPQMAMAKEPGDAPARDVCTEMAGGKGESPGLGSASGWARKAGAVGLPISLGSFHYTSPAAPLPGDSLIGSLRLSPATAEILERTNSSSSALPMGLGEGDRDHELPGDLTCHILLKTSPCRTLSLTGLPCTSPFTPQSWQRGLQSAGKGI